MLDDGRYYELNTVWNSPRPNRRQARHGRRGAQPRGAVIRFDDRLPDRREDGKTYRLPKNPAYALPPASAPARHARPTRRCSTESGKSARPRQLGSSRPIKRLCPTQFDDDRAGSASVRSWLALDLGAPTSAVSRGLPAWSVKRSTRAADSMCRSNGGTTWADSARRCEIRLATAATVVGVRLTEPVTAQEVRGLSGRRIYAYYRSHFSKSQPELRDTDASRLTHARVCSRVATEAGPLQHTAPSTNCRPECAGVRQDPSDRDAQSRDHTTPRTSACSSHRVSAIRKPETCLGQRRWKECRLGRRGRRLVAMGKPRVRRCVGATAGRRGPSDPI